MTDAICETLLEISQRWSHRQCPAGLPQNIPLQRLPKSSYDGSNPYNGFSGAERSREEQVLRVLRRQGIIAAPRSCDICGATVRIGFHAEDYVDPCSLAQVCFPCHMALHNRFKSPEKWLARLERYADSPRIDDFRSLPLFEVDFARWLRAHTEGPHDAARRVWPTRDIPDYLPRTATARGKQIADAFARIAVSETDRKLIEAIRDNAGSTSAILTQKMGWAGNDAWHLHFGRFCRRLEPFLGKAPASTERMRSDGTQEKFYIGLLADFDDATRGFTLKPETQHALDLMFS